MAARVDRTPVPETPLPTLEEIQEGLYEYDARGRDMNSAAMLGVITGIAVTVLMVAPGGLLLAVPLFLLAGPAAGTICKAVFRKTFFPYNPDIYKEAAERRLEKLQQQRQERLAAQAQQQAKPAASTTDPQEMD